MKKILIIRFSSFGDIIQSMSVVSSIVQAYPEAEIDFLTKSEFKSIVAIHPLIKNIWSYDKSSGLKGLLQIIKGVELKEYDLIFDAHNTLRTLFFKFFYRGEATWITRPKNRWKRFLFFKLKKREVLPRNFKGMHSFHWPLYNEGIEWGGLPAVQWKFTEDMQETIFKTVLNQILPDQKFITIAPSAAWEKKRWPIAHWVRLIELLPQFQFIILGGPGDSFCEEIKESAPLRVINTAGDLSLLESCCLTFLSEVVVSADTGILHVADLFGTSAVGLIGPTAFGFTSGESIKLLEVEMECRPCSKDGSGGCSQKPYQKCMVDITPEMVLSEIETLL